MPPDFSREVYCLLGLPFDAVDLAGAEQRIRAAAAQRRRCFLSTPNLNFLVACQSDAPFRNSVIHSDLVVADGMPLVWLCRLLGIPIRQRVAGSTLMERLRRNADSKLSVYFFGGLDGVAEAACKRLSGENRGLICAGYASPGFGSIADMSTDDIIQRINESHADFLVVALGARKGQAWIEHNLARLSVPVMSHLGAVVNFVAGSVRRAPGWLQSLGLEWIWRIKEEPALWRRYFADGLVLLRLVVTRALPYAVYLAQHDFVASQPAVASAEAGGPHQDFTVHLRGAWTRQNIAPLRECFSRAALAGKDVRLDLGEVTYVDSAFVGLVMLLHGHQTQHGRRVLLDAMPEAVRRVIRYCCVEYLYSGMNSKP